MPAVTSTKDLKEGGLRGITKFLGSLMGFEEDLEGEYGVQVSWTWGDAEVVESEEPIVLKNGQFKDWAAQKSHPRSSYGQALKIWEDFAVAHGMTIDKEGVKFGGFFGVPIVYEKVEFSFGDKPRKDGKTVSPGHAYVPVALHGSSGAVAVPAKTKAPTNSDKLREAVMGLAKSGTTRETMKRELNKQGFRAAIEAQGGMETVLKALVASGDLQENEGVYTA